MKLYPPRPWFIYPANVSQLWIIIPICIFLCFCKGGILNGIVVLVVWIIYQANKTEKYWRQACDDNVEHIYVSKDYAISKGYIKIGKQYCYLTDELRSEIIKKIKEKENEKEIVNCNNKSIPYFNYEYIINKLNELNKKEHLTKEEKRTKEHLETKLRLREKGWL